MTDIEETLLLEVHHAIAVSAKEAVEKLGQPITIPPTPVGDSPLERAIHALETSLVNYPPAESGDGPLTSAETEALVRLKLSPEARSGLEKLIADAASAAFFRFFCLLDAVGDPELEAVDEWYGAVLAKPSDNEDRAMLHDEFFESYWRYREALGTKP